MRPLRLILYTALKGAVGNASSVPAIDLGVSPLSSSCDSKSCRSPSGIAISCLVTILGWVWITVRLNLPYPYRYPIGTITPKENLRYKLRRIRKSLMERFFFCLIAMLWPEYIFAWTARQLVAAQSVSKNTGLTLTHGYYIIMGGFHLFDGPTPLYPIHHSWMDTLINHRGVEIPTESEIRDNSKQNPLIIVLVLVQTVWFITQCISRATISAGSSSITKLEIVTIASIAVHIVTYLTSFGKPHKINRPTRVLLSVVGELRQRDVGMPLYDHPIYQPVLMIIDHFDDDVDLSRLKKVPWYYSGFPPLSNKGVTRQTLIPSFLLVAISGGIHCIGWSISSPATSFPEIVLWRLFALGFYGCVVGPFAGGLLQVMDQQRRIWLDGRSRLELEEFGIFFHILAIPPILLYYISRIGLFVLAFMELRALAQGSQEQVYWTTLIPHI